MSLRLDYCIHRCRSSQFSRSTALATSPLYTPLREKTVAHSLDGWLATDRESDVYGITGNGGSGLSSSNPGDGTIFTIDRNGNESVVYDLAGGLKDSLPWGA